VKKVIYFLWPVILLMVMNQVIYPILRHSIKDHSYISYYRFFLSLVFTAIFIKLINLVNAYNKMKKPVVGNFSNFFKGVFVGSIVSILSIALFCYSNGINILFDKLILLEIISSAIEATPAALLEEVSFRHGIVYGANILYGKTFAILLGSVPFGLLHLINIVSGEVVSLNQIIGIILAGALLSILYLQYGLWSAVGCHLIWNALSMVYKHALVLPYDNFINHFEGAYTTSIVIFFTLILITYFNRHSRE